MWQRFSEKARRAIYLAQEEALRFGDKGDVGSEHLLLGITSDAENAAAKVLGELGIGCLQVYREMESQLYPAKTKVEASLTKMQLTPGAKQVIDFAYDEVRTLGSKYLGSEHLLLALIRQSTTRSGKVLAGFGIELEPARQVITELRTRPSTVFTSL